MCDLIVRLPAGTPRASASLSAPSGRSSGGGRSRGHRPVRQIGIVGHVGQQVVGAGQRLGDGRGYFANITFVDAVLGSGRAGRITMQEMRMGTRQRQ